MKRYCDKYRCEFVDDFDILLMTLQIVSDKARPVFASSTKIKATKEACRELMRKKT